MFSILPFLRFSYHFLCFVQNKPSFFPKDIFEKKKVNLTTCQSSTSGIVDLTFIKKFEIIAIDS